MAFLYQPVRRVTSAMPKLVLYKRDASPPACAVMLIARWLKLPLEFKEPDLLNMEQKSPEFRKLNPMGVIPVLVDGDFIVSESHAIVLYLLEKYGGDKYRQLYPEELTTRTLINQCLFFNSGFFFIRVKNVALPTLFGKLKEPTADHITDIEEACSVLEAYLAEKKYVAADHLTIADVCCGATAASMNATVYKLTAEKYPKTKAWLDRLEEEDGFKEIVINGGVRLGEIMNMVRAKTA